MNIVNLITLIQFRQPKIVQPGKTHFKRNRTAFITRLRAKDTAIIQSNLVKASKLLLINKCQNKLILPKIRQTTRQRRISISISNNINHNNNHLHRHQIQQLVSVVQRQQQSEPKQISKPILIQPITHPDHIR